MNVKDPVDELSAQGFIESHHGDGSWPTRSERYKILRGTPAETKRGRWWILMDDETPLSSQGVLDFGDWYVGGGTKSMVTGAGNAKQIANHVMELHTDKPFMIAAVNPALHSTFKGLGFRQVSEVPENTSGAVRQIAETILKANEPLFVRDSGDISKSFDYVWEFVIKIGGY